MHAGSVGQASRTYSPPVSTVMTSQTGVAARYSSQAGGGEDMTSARKSDHTSSEPVKARSLSAGTDVARTVDDGIAVSREMTTAAETGHGHSDVQLDAHSASLSASGSDVSSIDNDDDDDVIVISSSSPDDVDD